MANDRVISLGQVLRSIQDSFSQHTQQYPLQLEHREKAVPFRHGRNLIYEDPERSELACVSISACPFRVNRRPPLGSFSIMPSFSNCVSADRITPPAAFDEREGFMPRRFRPPYILRNSPHPIPPRMYTFRAIAAKGVPPNEVTKQEKSEKVLLAIVQWKEHISFRIDLKLLQCTPFACIEYTPGYRWEPFQGYHTTEMSPDTAIRTLPRKKQHGTTSSPPYESKDPKPRRRAQQHKYRTTSAAYSSTVELKHTAPTTRYSLRRAEWKHNEDAVPHFS